MKKYQIICQKKFCFLEVKISIYLHRRVFVMDFLDNPFYFHGIVVFVFQAQDDFCIKVKINCD